MELTPQQEKFAQLVASGMNQSAAYRNAYNAKQMKAETIHKRACELARDGKVTGRIAQIRAPIVEQARYGLKEAMEDAENARRIAMLMGQAGAAVSAVAPKAKLNRLLVEDRGNEHRPLEHLTDAELEQAIAETERAIAREKSKIK